MRDGHTKQEWYCRYCKTDSASPPSFSTPEELGGHVEKNHPNDVTDALRPTLVKHSMIRTRHAIRECPFCGGFPKDVEDDPLKFHLEPALQALEKHIRDHLVSVALILAPIETEEEAGQPDNERSEAQRDDQSERDLNGVGEQYELVCSETTCDCKKRSDLDFDLDISPGHDVREDMQAFWGDVEPLWKQIQDDKARDHENDPLPLGLLPQDPLPQDLEEYINNALSQSTFPFPEKRYFAPKKTLDAITAATITQTIWPDSTSSGNLEDSNKELINFIIRDAREILAICICIGMPHQQLRDSMQSFLKHHISDASLPLSNATMEIIWPKARDMIRRQTFQDSQYIFRAHMFSMKDRYSLIDLPLNTVLPILDAEAQSQGRFGLVYKVKIHPDYLDPDDPIRKVRLDKYLSTADKWPPSFFSFRRLSKQVIECLSMCSYLTDSR